MTDYTRYAIFDLPQGAIFDAASAWLGWNSVAKIAPNHPVLQGLPAPIADITAAPRKYGFHGTVKPPFRLVDGVSCADLQDALQAFCAARAPVEIPRLVIRPISGFVACAPETANAALSELASAAVAGLDPFRAPPAEAELARRRKAGLSDRQEAMLAQWGYPYVFEEFRFHLTLSGRVADPVALADRLTAYFGPVLPEPYMISSLCLMGEARDGMFHLLHRYPLKG